MSAWSRPEKNRQKPLLATSVTKTRASGVFLLQLDVSPSTKPSRSVTGTDPADEHESRELGFTCQAESNLTAAVRPATKEGGGKGIPGGAKERRIEQEEGCRRMSAKERNVHKIHAVHIFVGDGRMCAGASVVNDKVTKAVVRSVVPRTWTGERIRLTLMVCLRKICLKSVGTVVRADE